MSERKRPSLLIGSISLPDRAAVFEAVSRHLKNDLAAVPDGETGDRGLWVAWASQRLVDLPEIVQVGEMSWESPVSGWFSTPLLGPADGVDLSKVKFGPFGYLEEAVASYESFKSEREQGQFNPDTRFQVSLPTPMMFAMIFPQHRLDVLPALERDLEEEIARIVEAIPPEDLALQWDVAGETTAQEQFLRDEAMDESEKWPLEEVTESIARVSQAVPEQTSLGIHICYGSPDGNHIVEPFDLTISVQLANGAGRLIERRLDWIHMPIPIERDDDAFFVPLDDLELRPETELYLGLLHKEDGAEGASRRIAAATAHVEDFGVAAECGMGREPREAIEGLLELHHVAATL